MANDCLVTKLKGVVNNDNLPKLGIITFYVLPNQNDSIWFYTGESALSFKCGGDVTINGVAEGTLPANTDNRPTIVSGANGGWVDVDAYSIKGIGFSKIISRIVGLEAADFGIFDFFRIGGGEWAAGVIDSILDVLKGFKGMLGLMGNPSVAQLKGFIGNNPTTLKVLEGTRNLTTDAFTAAEISALPLQALTITPTANNSSYENYLNYSALHFLQAEDPFNLQATDLDAVVAKLRQAGRTTGKIKTAGLSGHLLYNGETKTVRQYLEARGMFSEYISNNFRIFLAWDASSWELTFDNTGYVFPDMPWAE